MKFLRRKENSQEGTLRRGTQIWDELARMDAMRAEREQKGEISFTFRPASEDQSRFGQTPGDAFDMRWEGR